MQPPPDIKDWTWTLDRACPECGLRAGEVAPTAVADRVFLAAEEWVQILRSSPAVIARPEPDVWSPLEYGAHIRDALGIFTERLRLILTTEDPLFADWDQDQAAVDGRYPELDPEEVADQLEAAAQDFVALARSIAPGDFDRPGRRSNGSVFTAATLLQYFLHDIVHHLWDVTGQQDGAAALALE